MNTLYTPEIADRFLGEIMGGRHMIDVCKDPGMPHHSTINRWVATDHEGFAARYRSARQVGRLSRAKVTYGREIANEVLDELMSGRTLDEVCADPEMPSATTVRQWVRDDVDGFAARYWEAREIGYQMIGDQALNIVDDRSNDWVVWQREDGTTARMLDPQRVNRALARVSTRRWLLSKMLPKTFGDRPDLHARQPAGQDDMAEFMKLLNGRDRGLPGEDEPRDEE
jgi:hypothetical protein